MGVIFDYTCSECDGKFEAFTRNSDTPPTKCDLCGSETATFKKHLVGPRWIEGTTPGSKPPSGHKHKIKNTADLYK